MDFDDLDNLDNNSSHQEEPFEYLKDLYKKESKGDLVEIKKKQYEDDQSMMINQDLFDRNQKEEFKEAYGKYGDNLSTLYEMFS